MLFTLGGSMFSFMAMTCPLRVRLDLQKDFCSLRSRLPSLDEVGARDDCDVV